MVVLQDLEQGRMHCVHGAEFSFGMTRAIRWTLGVLSQKRDRSPNFKLIDTTVRERIRVAFRYLSKCVNPFNRLA